MQISSNLLFERAGARMSALGSTASKLQAQIASGKKMLSLSEDVAVSQQIAEFDRKDADAAVYKTNLNLSSSLLQQADSTLESITLQMQRAMEIANNASTGTLNASDRKVLGNELSSIVDSLVGLGNTTDLRGQPLFGSTAGSAAVTRNGNGTFTYSAAPTLSEVPIGDGVTVQPTETAARIFNSSAGDALAILTTLSDALKTGADVSASARTAIDSINTATEQVSVVQASIGARGARVDLQQTLLQNASTDRAELRSSLEDVDPYEAYTELQKTLTILQATQQSFSKLSSMSLFDYLR